MPHPLGFAYLFISQAVTSMQGTTSTCCFLEKCTAAKMHAQGCQLGEQLIFGGRGSWGCFFFQADISLSGVHGLISVAQTAFQSLIAPLAKHFCAVHKLYHCTWQAYQQKLGWKFVCLFRKRRTKMKGEKPALLWCQSRHLLGFGVLNESL